MTSTLFQEERKKSVKQLFRRSSARSEKKRGLLSTSLD